MSTRVCSFHVMTQFRRLNQPLLLSPSRWQNVDVYQQCDSLFAPLPPPAPLSTFFKNGARSKVAPFSSIMDQYHIWFCLFCAKCQCAQVKRKAALCFILLINTTALNISSPPTKGPRRRHCLTPGVCRASRTPSPSLPASVVWVLFATQTSAQDCVP